MNNTGRVYKTVKPINKFYSMEKEVLNFIYKKQNTPQIIIWATDVEYKEDGRGVSLILCNRWARGSEGYKYMYVHVYCLQLDKNNTSEFASSTECTTQNNDRTMINKINVFSHLLRLNLFIPAQFYFPLQVLMSANMEGYVALIISTWIHHLLYMDLKKARFLQTNARCISLTIISTLFEIGLLWIVNLSKTKPRWC